MTADRFDIALLPGRLGSDVGLFGRGVDALGVKVFQRRDPFVFDDFQGLGKLAVAHSRAGFERSLQQMKHLLGALDALCRAIQPDPAFTRGGFDT